MPNFQIINRAASLNEDPISLSARFANEFHVDMDSLNCLRPTVEPKVTTHIDAIISMIQKVASLRTSLNSAYSTIFELASDSKKWACLCY